MKDLKIIDHTRDRYHTLSISSVWELARLRNARALVVGAGAIGNEVCKNLAMMGIQLMVVLDRDTVEAANLSRSIFFRERDHGSAKAETISARLKEFNPDVEVLALTGDLDQKLGLGIVRRMDMIFSCLDSRLARRTLNRMCGKMVKPWIDGAMENLLGEVAVYVPDYGPCYECTLTEMQKALIAEAASCRGIALHNIAVGKVPTTSTMGSIIAALQVQEALKLLHGDYKNSLAGKSMVINCNINDFYITATERKADEHCDGHQRYGAISEVPEFAAGKTTPRTMLARFKEETGEDGSVNLGREVVTELYCPKCGKSEILGEPIRMVAQELEKCRVCRQVRQLKTTHEVRENESYADWPLERLGIPKLDVLEVRGKDSILWYEMTEDLEFFPAVLQSKKTKVQRAKIGKKRPKTR